MYFMLWILCNFASFKGKQKVIKKEKTKEKNWKKRERNKIWVAHAHVHMPSPAPAISTVFSKAQDVCEITQFTSTSCMSWVFCESSYQEAIHSWGCLVLPFDCSCCTRCWRREKTKQPSIRTLSSREKRKVQVLSITYSINSKPFYSSPCECREHCLCSKTCLVLVFWIYLRHAEKNTQRYCQLNLEAKNQPTAYK